jgi:hypothetical protein
MKIMKVTYFWIFIIVLVGWAPVVRSEEEPKLPARAEAIKETIFSDYKNFYSLGNLGRLGAGLGMGAILANTSMDRDVRDWYQGDVRDGTTDNLSQAVGDLGSSAVAVPAFAGAALIGEFTKDSPLGSVVGEWGRRSLRAFITGGPPLLFLQYGLGGARPTEGDSHWRPFSEDNSVSGHSFNGAIPFLTAARMVENPYLKWSLYLASPLIGLTRINDDQHYLSQVSLGWWLAFLAMESVDKTEARKKEVSVIPIPIHDGLGVLVTMRF